MRSRFRMLAVFVLTICPLLWIGCGAAPVEGPDTVPLQGKVVFTKGGSSKILSDHSVAVQFECVEKPDTQAFGEILEDGSFTMVTQVGGRGKQGVIPGTHRIRLNADDSGARFVAPKFLDYPSSGLTIKIPAEKELIIEVWK